MGSGMRRAVPLAGFAIAALALASCGDDETAGDERTLTYFEGREGTFEQFGKEQRPGGAPQPRVVTTAGSLEDADGNAVGDLHGFCVVSRVSEGGDKDTCTGIADLPDGQLNISYGGDIKGPPGETGSIIGGTGDYAGATGTYEVKVVLKKGQRPKHTFTFTLP